jgi:hypothetical protein
MVRLVSLPSFFYIKNSNHHPLHVIYKVTSKLKGGKSYGKCAMKDGSTPILNKIADVDILIDFNDLM